MNGTYTVSYTDAIVEMAPFTTAVPGEVEEVRVAFVVPFLAAVICGVISPSVVENATSVQFTILPNLSVTMAVIVEFSVPPASMMAGYAVREIADGLVTGGIDGIWYIWYLLGLAGSFGSMNWKLQGIAL